MSYDIYLWRYVQSDEQDLADTLDDAYQDLADRFILVSGDSDLVPAVTTIKEQFPAKEIIVYIPSHNPTRGAAVELRAATDTHRILPQNLLRHA